MLEVPGRGRRREEARELPGSLPVSWRSLAGGGRKAILSDMRSVMLRLGDAPAGKADAVPDFQQFAPALTRKGGCFGAVRPFATRGAFQNVR